MQKARHITSTALALVIATFVIVNCTGTMGDNDWANGIGGSGGGDDEGGGGGGGGGDGETWEAGVACDPDGGGAPCYDDFFICTVDDAGNKRCEGQNPATPDDGAWECYEEGTTMVCRGDHVPSDTGYWTCEELGDSVICRGHAYVPVGDGAWTCWYEGSTRVCGTGATGGGGDTGEGEGDGTGDDGTGDDGVEGGGGEGEDGNEWDQWFPDDNGDGLPDGLEDLFEGLMQDFWEDLFNGGGDTPGDDTPGDDTPGDDTPGDDTPPGCMCVPGAWRYCDTPTYCAWGVQYCDDDGMGWGYCNETGIPAQCSDSSWYSTDAEACCIDAGLCCQDMWDLDYDGDTWESLGSCTDITCG